MVAKRGYQALVARRQKTTDAGVRGSPTPLWYRPLRPLLVPSAFLLSPVQKNEPNSSLHSRKALWGYSGERTVKVPSVTLLYCNRREILSHLEV